MFFPECFWKCCCHCVLTFAEEKQSWCHSFKYNVVFVLGSSAFMRFTWTFLNFIMFKFLVWVVLSYVQYSVLLECFVITSLCLMVWILHHLINSVLHFCFFWWQLRWISLSLLRWLKMSGFTWPEATGNFMAVVRFLGGLSYFPNVSKMPIRLFQEYHWEDFCVSTVTRIL